MSCNAWPGSSSSLVPALFQGQEPQTRGSEACTPVPLHSCLVIAQAQNILVILCTRHPLEWTVSSWMLDPCMIQNLTVYLTEIHTKQ